MVGEEKKKLMSQPYTVTDSSVTAMQGQLVNLFVGDPDSMTLNNKAKHG